MRFSDEICVSAPAKINLVLRILDRLPNGYHRIWSVMQMVDLADRVRIRRVPDGSDIHIACTLDSVPKGSANLVYRAAQLVQQEAGDRGGLAIDLTKRIPIAAGLGGGSSDAAATIIGLVRLFNLDWSVSRMAGLGARLGSDVPFFFFGPTAVISGWGQDVFPLNCEQQRWVVLVNPGFPIGTGWAYERLASVRRTLPAIDAEAPGFQANQSVTWAELMPLMDNDFEPALFPIFPQLARIKLALLAEGAEKAMLSGSGATMFGMFADQGLAEKAKTALEGEGGCGQVMVAATRVAPIRVE